MLGIRERPLSASHYCAAVLVTSFTVHASKSSTHLCTERKTCSGYQKVWEVLKPSACVLSAASLWLLFACIWVCSYFWVVELLRKTWTAEVCRTHVVKLIWGKHKDHLFQLLLGRNTHFNSDNGFKIKCSSFPSLGSTWCLCVGLTEI